MPRGGGRGGGRQKPITYNQRAGLKWVEKNEPAFIREMKAKLGYRETKIEDKFDHSDAGPSAEKDDEFGEDGPQVVVLDPSKDISREELDKELAAKQKEEDDKLIAEGKITFKKPTLKRATEDDTKKAVNEKKTRRNSEEEAKKTPNTNLLSFGGDDDDDDE